MEEKLSKEQFVKLVAKLMRGEGTEEEGNAWIRILKRNVPHPAVSDLIFWPNVYDLPDNLTAEEIVEIALAYKPIQLGPRTDQ